MTLKDFDLSNLDNYPNIGISDPKNPDKIDELQFNGNYKIRGEYQKLAFTEEALKRREECYSDIFKFFEEVRMYQTGKGYAKIQLWEHQVDYIKKIFDHKLLLAMFGRRLAKSTTAYVVELFLCLTNDDFKVGIAVIDDDLKMATVTEVMSIYEALPPWLQRGVKKYNQRSIIFDNGSSIDFALIKKSTFRGQQKSLIHADELAFSDKAGAFFDSIDPIVSENPSVKLLITSTPNGKDAALYRLWSASERGDNDFVRIKRTWECRPDRDEAWKETEIKNRGLLSFQRNHECSFEGSSPTLIDAVTLRHIEDTTIQKDFEFFDETEMVRVFKEKSHRPDVVYFIGCDTSKSSATSADGSDAISFHVIELDLKTLKFEQVGVFHSEGEEGYHYLDTAEVLDEIGREYEQNSEDALIIVENNSGDGQSIVDQLDTVFEYENIFSTSRRSDVNGFQTNKKTKIQLLKMLKLLIEKRVLTIRDQQTLYQLERFIKQKGSYSAIKGEHDDLVMALAVCFAWLLEEDNEYGLTIDDFINNADFDKEVEENDKEFIIDEKTGDILRNEIANDPYTASTIDLETGLSVDLLSLSLLR